MNKQRKKLTLNKETLRDLTPQNTGEVKGGTSRVSCASCSYCCPSIACTYATCKCHGKTYNKKCGY